MRAATTTETWDEVDKLQMKARESIMREHLLWKSRYDSKYTKPVQYNVGDILCLYGDLLKQLVIRESSKGNIVTLWWCRGDQCATQ